MNDLFCSEKQCVLDLLHKIKIDGANIAMDIESKMYAKPRRPGLCMFNCDFLYFFKRKTDSPVSQFNISGIGEAILPQTMGVEVYVCVEKDTQYLISFDLVGGEGFSIKYYKKYISKIESSIDAVIAKMTSFHPSKEQYTNDALDAKLQVEVFADYRKPLAKCRYLRVFVIDGIIYFLAFPKDEIPEQRGTSYCLIENELARVDCGFDSEGIVYLDGWLKTERQDKTDRYLVSLLE